MNRREFVKHSTGLAALAALPLGVSAASMARRDLLDDPQAWLGESFRLADGGELRLATVERVADDTHTRQWRLHFQGATAELLADGTHALLGTDCEHQLFLQSGQQGMVACINRLRTFS